MTVWECGRCGQFGDGDGHACPVAVDLATEARVWLGFNEAGMSFVWDDPSTCTKGDGTPMDHHEWMRVPVGYMRAAFAAMKTGRAAEVKMARLLHDLTFIEDHWPDAIPESDDAKPYVPTSRVRATLDLP